MVKKEKKTKPKKKGFSIEFRKGVKKAEDIIKKDIQKMEKGDSSSFLLTYGWAILVILIGLGGFVWWQYFSIQMEKCDFVEGSGLMCEKFDVTNEGLNIEIRNLNNESIILNQITLKSCSINPEQSIPNNDRRSFSIPCNISSGRLREKIVVAYKIEDFQKHVVAKLAKVVP